MINVIYGHKHFVLNGTGLLLTVAIPTGTGADPLHSLYNVTIPNKCFRVYNRDWKTQTLQFKSQ